MGRRIPRTFLLLALTLLATGLPFYHGCGEARSAAAGSAVAPAAAKPAVHIEFCGG